MPNHKNSQFSKIATIPYNIVYLSTPTKIIRRFS